MAPDNYKAGEDMFNLLGEASFGTVCLCALRYTADASAYVFTAVHCETGISAFLRSSLVTSAFQQAASVYAFGPQLPLRSMWYTKLSNS